MDNNQNNMFNGQPAQPQQFAGQPQQFAGQPAQPYGQPVQQPFGQQGQQPFGQPMMAQPKNVNLGLIGLIISSIALLTAFIGSIFVCTCSADKSFDILSRAERMASDGKDYSVMATSLVVILTLVAAVVAVGGILLSIAAYKKNSKSKLNIIGLALGVFALLYALVPTLVVCGYNCSINSAYDDKKEEAEQETSYNSNSLEDLYNKYN